MATILVIEDSEIHRVEIRAAIDASRLFDRVLEAADGLRGLKLLLSESVDLVLCDLEMPGLDGEKLLRVKRSSPRVANVPFVFLTACQDLDRRATAARSRRLRRDREALPLRRAGGASEAAPEGQAAPGRADA